MVEKERVYTIPLRREFLKVPKYRRSRKAITAIRQFVSKHMKVDDVKIGSYLNLKIWEHGKKNPIHKVKVRTYIDKKDDKEFAKVELFDAPEEVRKEEKKKSLGEKIKDKVVGKREVKEDKKENVEKKTLVKQKNLEDVKVKEDNVDKKKKIVSRNNKQTSGPK
jgi:large subunit ribosomal protein L31e